MHSAPLLGPSLGPIVGGLLTQGFNWRATFWFLAIFTGLCTLSFVFFRDTFRRERSMTYQTVLKRVLENEAKKVAEAQTQAAPPESEKAAQDDGASARVGAAADQPDVEAQTVHEVSVVAPPIKEIRLSLKDVNPLGPMVHVLRRLNNVTILVASGEYFVFSAIAVRQC